MTYLVIGYVAAVVLIGGYVTYLWRRTEQLRGELEERRRQG